MPDLNQQLYDTTVKHAVLTQRYSRGLAKKIVGLLNSTDRDLVQKLAERIAGIQARGFDSGPTVTKRINDVLDSVKSLNQNVYDQIAKELEANLHDFAQHEAETQAKVLNKSVPVDYTATVPTPGYLRELVQQSPVDGYLLQSWTNQMSANRLGRIEKQLRVGLVQGETVPQLVTRVKNVLPISRRSAAALARTAVSTVSNNARMATYKANDDVIKSVQFTATLDDATSEECQDHDGEVYPLDEVDAQPPLHVNCRSTLVPVAKSWEEMGIPKDEADEGVRASMTGQVPASMNYGDWLKSQSAEVQDKVLGQQRGELFRDNNLSFKELFKDDSSYKSLDQLKAAIDS